MSFFIRPDLNINEIEQRENDYSLFHKYCKSFKKIKIKFRAEFRKDNHPSASINEYKGRLWYKDFGNPNQEKAYDIYQFIMKKFNLSFFETLKKINEDFNLGLGYNTNVKISPVKYKIKTVSKIEKIDDIPSIIKIKKIKFTNKHINYWMQYDITKDKVLLLTKKYNISAISHFWLTTSKLNNKMYVVNDIGFNYDYYWHLGVLLRKIYLPNQTKSRFFTNCNKLITQGYEQLPTTGNLVFITSSLKDVVILNNCGFDAVAPSNENIFIQEHIFEDLKNRFKKIVLYYDNDFNKSTNWGKKFAEKYSKKYNIPYITTPDNTEKDPSDFCKSFGKKELFTITKKELKNVSITL